ncbi:MAG: adenosylmethionine-8-amino-7-oxononanoate aminotransferase [Planctomycetota bacterium]|jgi:adenosylmethionine-8-amino-7-oxononanoate aminotransferase
MTAQQETKSVTAKELQARDAAHCWHPYTQHGVDSKPLVVKAALGSKLVLADGTELIDAIASWWTCLHGHGAPALVQAMQRQSQELDHVLFAGATHEPAIRLAEELVALAPQPTEAGEARLTRAFFSDDGSTAVEVALKIAAGAWVNRGERQRTVFLSLEGGYHGDTFGAMAVGDPVPFFEPYGPFLFQACRIQPTVEQLEQAFETQGDRVAGLLLEPLVQGAAGMRMHSVEFLQAARRMCTEHGVPLIADEVFTGFGRVGATYACERAGIVPDLLVTAKGLTGGMFPLAVTLATEDLFGAFLSLDRSRFFPHGHTMTASPIGCAVALASIGLLRKNDVPARLEAIGARVFAGLEELQDHPRVHDLRHLGGIVAMDLTPPSGESGGYLSGLQPMIRRRAIELGILLRPLGNVFYTTPPACLDDEEVDRIAAAMVTIVRELP